MTAPSVTETDPARAARDDDPGDGGARELPRIDPDAYELLGEIARGGMGRISRARDRLGRVVAVKQLLDPSPQLIALFEREARITARLQHPSIVSVIEAGVLPNGERMYAMKLVPGRALRDVLRDSLAVSARLSLLPIAIAIADALAYAHQEGVIHRDLKPSNVLIGEFGEVVVIDWGLAHDARAGGALLDDGERASAAPGAATDVTARAMGTPAYMAPEAARGEPADERADVYAIGAILYETLAGAPPYRGDDGAAIMAAVRAGPPEPIARRAPGTPADLAAIVDKAMARERGARYPSARELADELRRFATGQLVSAHVYSLRDRAWRWVRRHRAPVAVGGGAAALVITLVAVGVSRIVHERDVAADRAEHLTLAQARLQLDRDPVAALQTLIALPVASAAWSAARTIAADALARHVPRHLALDAPVEALAIADGRPRALVRGADDAIEIAGVDGAIGRVAGRAAALAISADGGTFAAVGDGLVRVWRTGPVPALVLERPGPSSLNALALSGDGSLVAVAGRDTGLAAWQIAGGIEAIRDPQARGIEHLAIAADPVMVFDGSARWPESGAAAAPARRLTGVAAARGMAIAALASGELRFIDTGDAGGAERVTAGVRAAALASSPGGARIAAASDQGITVLDRDGRVVRAIATRRRARMIAIDDRGAVAIADGAHVWWWDAVDPDRTYAVGDAAPAIALAVARDQIVSVTEDGAVLAWRAGAAVRLGSHTGAARAVALSSDGRAAVTAGDDGAVRRWSLAGAAPPAILGVHRGPGFAIAIAPGGALVASGGGDRVVRLWHAGTGEAARPAGAVLGQHAGAIRALAFSPDGGALASIAEDAVAKVWALAGGGAARVLDHGAPVTAIAWMPDGAIVTGARDGHVRWWPAGGGAARILCTHRGAVRSVAAAGARIASAGDDGRVGLGDRGGMRVFGGHDDFVRRVAFSPDGAAVASASEDGTIRLWDPISGESRAVAIGAWAADVAFTSDGAAVLAAGGDGGLWRIGDGLPRDRRALRAAIEARLEAAR